MVRTIDDEPCLDSSPRRCHECFPEISPQTFYMRKRFIQSQFDLVDLFVAPSRFLLERYVDWGIPREKIVAEEYGRTPPPGIAADGARDRRNRFGYFGQLTPFKGVQVVLEAVAELLGRTGQTDPLIRALETAATSGAGPAGPVPEVYVHGANLDLQPGPFQNRIGALLEETRDCVTFIGRYDHDRMAALMSNVDWVIVPSIWWENSPLVIQEAFHFRRPVICSDIGGMAEKVTDGIDGLHFRAGDAASLARTMRRAMETTGLWERLRAGITPVHPMTEHAERMVGIYRSLLRHEEVAHVG
jgi:glycosyltransferase involved in cell wall biosynthesis